MPIIEEENGVYVDYTIPEDVKAIISDEFLREFRNQLFRMHEYYSLEQFADMNTSTAGWAAAFGKACLLTGKEALLDYYSSLPWYDSDLFDEELADMLIEKRLILNTAREVIADQLNVKIEDIHICCSCQQYYLTEMGTIDDGDGSFQCFYCQDKGHNEGERTTDYYRDALKEINCYKEKHPLINNKNDD